MDMGEMYLNRARALPTLCGPESGTWGPTV